MPKIIAYLGGLVADTMTFPGGRQVEGSAPTAWALQQVCASPKVKAGQDSGKFTVLFDSGIRTGSDIIKAIALGAQGVLRKPSRLPTS